MKLRLLLFSLFLSPFLAWAGQSCPSEDNEAALELKTAAGPILEVCGFEDHEVASPKGTRAFSDFAVYFTTGAGQATGAVPVKIFQSEESETYWVRTSGTRALEIEQIWFFNDKPIAGLHQEIICTVDECKVSQPKCVYKTKKNPFPKALTTFNRKSKEGKLTEDGEELLDQIFAQALGGDKAARSFYDKLPEGLGADLIEVYQANQKKLSLECPKG